ncbi:jg22749 [Pararge aegeria aegeria]|uniref:Jg22749 protein n=1 Tax=Pararge aegeria aegeria TaxID=348720 RepID=A0A8S4RU06_9NEOP|nr:jg22749 [Pararge aegeria aegeria]
MKTRTLVSMEQIIKPARGHRSSSLFKAHEGRSKDSLASYIDRVVHVDRDSRIPDGGCKGGHNTTAARSREGRALRWAGNSVAAKPAASAIPASC